MRVKVFHAMIGISAVLMAIVAAPALAQPKPTTGADTKPICATCHETQHTSIVLTAHGAKNDAAGSMCQSCHGDASEHLKDPTKAKPVGPFTTKGATAAQKSAICLTCHEGNRHLQFWDTGKHAKNEVACTNCHDIHGKPGAATADPYRTSFRPLENEQYNCNSCHQQIRAETMKPSHHPIVEGKIKCSDCHNPHGALTPGMLKAENVNQQCTSCHADKRGPYVFAHPAVEENCLSCHSPHGSVYARLLNEKVPNLCQDCHDVARHPGTPYGAGAAFQLPNGAPNPAVNTRFIARGCLNCHNAIHGSNAPANRGQFLIR
jgi:DmsE family decaheme c-type cytochrome